MALRGLHGNRVLSSREQPFLWHEPQASWPRPVPRRIRPMSLEKGRIPDKNVQQIVARAGTRQGMMAGGVEGRLFSPLQAIASENRRNLAYGDESAHRISRWCPPFGLIP